MSRIGQQPVKIPEGVEADYRQGVLVIKGPKGELKQKIRSELNVAIGKGEISVMRKKNDKFSRSLHGLTRTLIANMIKGMTEGYSKVLKLVGTGYRVKKEGEKLVLSLGFSHPVEIEPIKGVQFEVPDKETIKVLGVDKGLVGQVAAKIRQIRPPEPYKGKGIRYEGEEVRRKPGKAGKVGAAGFGPGE
ncbi:50S ribosomal protein L6 [Microgenomates bacterium DG_75]|nr:MAG: 50S ribosomal protein L6 [Microgenomates bacterium DG_75]